MRKHFTFKKISITLFSIFLIIQGFRIDTSNPPVSKEKDFIAVTHPSLQVISILRNACYDCHSNTTTYPWYSQIAPVSWWLKDHINDGRKHLNFSTWADYNGLKKDKKLSHAVDEVLEGGMPLDSYTWMHEKSKLTQTEQKILAGFFKSLRTYESAKQD